jgi:hypothetical protein
VIYVHVALLLLGGSLASSAFIASKRPDRKDAIDRLAAFMPLVGVALLAFSTWAWLQIGIKRIFELPGIRPLGGTATVCAVMSGVLLGILFGFPRLEQKLHERSTKVAPIQMIIGMIALGSGVILLLIELRILKP